MPCECDPAQAYEELKELADAATRAACDMGTIIRNRKLLGELTPETRAWIRAHDAADAKRMAEETENELRMKTKEVALSKLTAAERRSLGL